MRAPSSTTAAPFRQAVLDGVLDPERVIQIGIRGGAEYLWEFSYESRDDGDPLPRRSAAMGIDAVAPRRARCSATGRPMSPSTSTASIPASRRAPARPRSAASRPREALADPARLSPASTSSAATSSRSRRNMTPTNITAQCGAQMLFTMACLAVEALKRRRG